MGSTVFVQKDIPVNGTLSRMIDLSNMAEGIYYVKVEGASTMLIQKLIIRK
jgi:hypothetical protein